MNGDRENVPELSLTVWRDGPLYVADLFVAGAVDLASQGPTLEEALNNLAEALDLRAEPERAHRPRLALPSRDGT